MIFFKHILILLLMLPTNLMLGNLIEDVDLLMEKLDRITEGEERVDIEINIGKKYLDIGEYNKSIEWCKKGMNYSNLSLDDTSRSCECLAKAYEELGQVGNALKYQKRLGILKDSLHQEELFVKANNFELKEKYEKDLALVKQNQAIETEESKIKMAWMIAGLCILFMTILILISVAYVKRTTQKNQLTNANAFRKELIANVSHDLRTPITVAQGYVETILILGDSANSEIQTKYLNIVLNNLEKLSGLVGHFFEYSKLETDQIQPQKVPFNIDEIIKDTIEEYKVLAKKKNIELVIDCPKDTLVVFADLSLVVRVLQNLLDNALKFTPENGIIEVCLKPSNDKMVEVAVIDNGPGIDDKQKAKIFNRHEKTKSSQGAGLGLAIVKKIVELHEGVISVKSELGQGTKFTFSLPSY